VSFTTESIDRLIGTRAMSLDEIMNLDNAQAVTKLVTEQAIDIVSTEGGGSQS
jgi:hypothetical protein